jgi:hypothetical protein
MQAVQLIFVFLFLGKQTPGQGQLRKKMIF